jgi:hypothetical protein
MADPVRQEEDLVQQAEEDFLRVHEKKIHTDGIRFKRKLSV